MTQWRFVPNFERFVSDQSLLRLILEININKILLRSKYKMPENAKLNIFSGKTMNILNTRA
jgi:hypothetical protein